MLRSEQLDHLFLHFFGVFVHVFDLNGGNWQFRVIFGELPQGVGDEREQCTISELGHLVHHRTAMGDKARTHQAQQRLAAFFPFNRADDPGFAKHPLHAVNTLQQSACDRRQIRHTAGTMNHRFSDFFLFLALALVGFALPAVAQNDQLPKEDPAAEGEAKNDDDAGLAESEDEFGLKQIEMLANVIELIRQNYHDEEQVNYQRLINSALEGMLANLDPHCQFMHPELFAQMKRETDGTYEGVGITIAFRNEVLTIVAVREDGPAARNGVLPGDQIIKINEFLADKLGLSEAIQMMRGKPGQKLRLTVRRPANNQLVEVEMTREVIRESTVKDVALLEERYAGRHKIGYIRLTQFSEPTVKEMVDGLNELEAKGMEALVLDLRNNPGGLLSSAVNTCGEFVEPGTVVLTTEGREAIANTKVYRTSPNKRRTRNYPLAILVNHSSASGAEVVSGALQDLRRAVVVGETSFGKGSVQSIIPVPGGGGTAIRLTTAKYYTPSKRTIHENGVFPNIVATMTPGEERNLMMWYRRDTLPPTERKKIEKWQDRQLARAADALRGALVYAEVFAPKEAEPEPKSEPAPEPKSEPKPAPEPKSEPEPAPEPKSEPKPAPEPKSEPKPAPEPKSEPEPAPEPKSEPEPVPEPKSEPKPTPEPENNDEGAGGEGASEE